MAWKKGMPMMPPEFTQDLDNVINDLEGRIALHRRAQEQPGRAGKEPPGKEVLEKLVQSPVALTLLGAVGEAMVLSLKRDLRERPSRIILKGLIGAVTAGAIFKHFSKKTSL